MDQREGLVSSRVGPLLMAIASFSMRVLEQPGTADILALAGLAALTLSIQRGSPFSVAAPAVSRVDRHPHPAGPVRVR